MAGFAVARFEAALGRRYHVVVTLELPDTGTRFFAFEAEHGQQRIEFPEHTIDSLRRVVVSFEAALAATQGLADATLAPSYCSFGGQQLYKVEAEQSEDGEIVHVVDLTATPTSGRLSIPVECFSAFVNLLFDDRLGFPSGCLERVMSYHSLLQLAFPNVSGSLNATMGHRSGFLMIDIAQPRLTDPVFMQQGEADEDGAAPDGRAAGGARRAKPKAFKSRLGLRTRSPTSVNYDELLAALGVATRADTQEESEGVKQKSRDRLPPKVLDLGLGAAQIKNLKEPSLRLKVDAEDLEDLRTLLGSTRDGGDFFIGLDIVDLWFLDRSRKVRALRFPLYFAEVALVDLGSEIEVRFRDRPKLVLNFLALCDVVLRFCGSRAVEHELHEVLTRIQNCRFEWVGRVEKVAVQRGLPLADGLLSHQRRLLLGQDERGPIGGALEGLAIEHVTIDSERTLFFARHLAMSEADLALAADLERIGREASTSTSHFNATLLGSVFNPLQPAAQVAAVSKNKTQARRERLSMATALPRCNPYELPDALHFLFDEFERKDLLLVEGPPGTGKTFSMLSLLVHCVCTGKRVLVVSDKSSALDALYEKMVGFMEEGLSDEREHHTRDIALRAGVKRPKWHDKSLGGIQDAARVLRAELRLELVQEILVSGRGAYRGQPQTSSIPETEAKRSPEGPSGFFAELLDIDKRIKNELAKIDQLLVQQFGESVPAERRICSRNWHETTAEDIRDLADFCHYLVQSPDVPSSQIQGILRSFIRNRQELVAKLYPDVAAEFCPADYRNWRGQLERLQRAQVVLETILAQRPLVLEDLMVIAEPLNGTRWPVFLASLHARAFTAAIRDGGQASALRRLRDKLFFPLAEDLQNLLSVVRDELKLFSLESLVKRRCVSQLARLHRFLCREGGVASPCLAWAIVHEVIGISYPPSPASLGNRAQATVGSCLHQISELQAERTALVRRRFTEELLSAFRRHVESEKRTTARNETASFDPLAACNDLVAEIDSRFERVVKSDNVGMAIESFHGLKEVIAGCFPVWLLLKDQVSLALPMVKGLFDVVIIDESTQCRVDDAIPLIYRARKVIAVGDENQTVLQRSSALDDFLFENFELESHLHAIGAASVKAAGSHFFGLLKGLKQSRILLDEHFRCPPEVIEYSNKYVYDGLLKIMKWRPTGSPDPVIVDYSERRTRNRNRPTSGKFKGIEVGMIDRFFEWVERSILAFEHETGRRIKLETDVAICYFLLKNEEYIKKRKADFLRSMKRGDDVLDGAGAALQGKERDLIFFLWDITRANFQAFMQGDDPAKRKGELNVLMSRPRLRAYHYLHKDFAALDHSRSSITHYLWSAYKTREEAARAATRSDREASAGRSADVLHDGDSLGPWDQVGPQWAVRSARPSPVRLPWRRTDGQLLYELLRVMCERMGIASELARYRPQFGVIVGRPEHRVDLVLHPAPGHGGPRLALVELSGFETVAHAGELQAFASILGRAQPALVPVFLHTHELFAPKSFVHSRLLDLLRSREPAASS